MNKADNENLKSFHKDLKEVKRITIPANTLKVGDTINFEIKANLKADNLPMSAEEFFFEELKEDLYSTPQFMEMYANYLLSHHINALTERKYSEEEVDFLIKLLRTTTEYEVLESFRNKVEQFKK